MGDNPYHMTISLNILNHLGINLYSNVPAVLSEVVANSWDADADEVRIDIDIPKGVITITDDGHGMTQADVNDKYLTVGFQRRIGAPPKTPKHGREPMGRKGIGKLSLFSIAEVVDVYTTKDGEKNAFRMDAKDIEAAIKKKGGEAVYAPAVLTVFPSDLQKGTRIVLQSLKKNLHKTAPALRRRLARRFSILGAEHKFNVVLDGKAVTVLDRQYFDKLQYLWWYGNEGKAIIPHCKLEHAEERTGAVHGTPHIFSGWIGTVGISTALQDNEAEESLNRIVIMVRGKLAQEDILEVFNEGGVYAKYLIGEIHADFLDVDTDRDIATSSRQRIIEDDPRYEKLKEALHRELLHVQNKWKGLREDEGAEKALKMDVVKAWFSDLPPDHKKIARSLLGKIGKLPIDSESDRKRLIKHSILAFESLAAKRNLARLEELDESNLDAFSKIIADIDDIEATWYHQILEERIRVIETLQKYVDENALEKALQAHLYDHLWLLDPHWERATDETPIMEERVKTAFAEIDAKLSEEELKGRLDIRYKTTAGKHVIIELKRAERRVDSTDLLKQAKKYRRALQKVLEAAGREDEPVEVICIVGKKPSDWETKRDVEEARQSMAEFDIRVVRYDELIDTAQKAYKSFLDRRKEKGRIRELIAKLDDDAE